MKQHPAFQADQTHFRTKPNPYNLPVNQIILILIILCTLVISGCATPTEEIKYTNSFENGVFLPVRFHINRNEPVRRNYISRLDEVDAAFKKSNLFFDIGATVDSPYIIDVKLDSGTTDSAINSAGVLLSAATLFIVPSKVHNYNTLNVDFYINGQLVKNYTYREDYEETLSITDAGAKEYDINSNEFKSIRNLVARFLQDFDNDSLMPRLIAKESQPDKEISI